MIDCLLLRFRDMLRNTVDEHNAIAHKSKDGKVLWGWWKKETEPFPDPYLSDLREDLERGGSADIFFINSGNNKTYKATLYRIHYHPNKDAFCPGEANEMCPEYYNQAKLLAWFEVGELTEIDPSYLESYVFSTQNSTQRISDKDNSAISPTRIGQPVDTREFDFLQDNVSLWFVCKKDDLKSTSIKKFPSISYKTYLTRGKYILHLSDLHFGKQHTFAVDRTRNSAAGKQTLVESICRDLKKQKISNDEIALVLISGDLTCTASSQEFNAAAHFINEMQKQFGLGAGQIVCVPGNHDIEWIDSDGIIDEDAELNYKLFSNRIYKDDPEETLIRINEFYVGKRKVAIIALNSCRLESKENAGIGFVGTEQLQLIEEFNAENTDVDYKIALVHHHLLPVNYTEQYSRQQREVSLLLDAEALMQCLITNGVKTVLHGHQHQPYFSQIRRMIPNGVAGHEEFVDGTLNIVGSGSSGVNQAGLNSIGRNTYQILELCDDSNGNTQLNIRLRVRNSDGVGYIQGWSKTL